jgi:hypothetical protein
MKFKTWMEGTIDPQDVLGMVQASPQMPGEEYDWAKYAEKWGIGTEPFVEGTMPVRDLVDMVNSGRLHLSSSLDQSDIGDKAKRLLFNPIIITAPANFPRLAIVDGSHSLVAAHQSQQESVDVIVAESAVRRLGMSFQPK